ncbi:MAG: hypothetical protein IT373_28910 [Polyangiaceae bacterium]|nr:hypothetical protein [Polyangiaceae bacterium]
MQEALDRLAGPREAPPVLWLVLGLSLVGLALGPALYAVGRARPGPAAVLDGLTLGLVPALVVLKLLPHVVEDVGLGAVGLAALGYGVVWLADRRSHDLEARVGRSLVVPALVLHAAVDGATLGLATGGGAEPGGAYLALAVLSHRMPEGLFLANALVPALGWRGALLRIGSSGAATVVGAALGRGALGALPMNAIQGLVALGLGAILRLVAHDHGSARHTAATRRLGALGLGLGAFVALALPDPESVLTRATPGELPMVDSFVALFAAVAPAAIVGVVASALARAGLRRRRDRAAAPSAWLSALAWPRDGRAARRALEAGRAAGAGPVALGTTALAAAALDPTAVLAAAFLLGPEAALACAGATLALGAGALAARPRVHPGEHLEAHEPTRSGRAASDLRGAARRALEDTGGPWVTGVALAAALEAFVPPGTLEPLALGPAAVRAAVGSFALAPRPSALVPVLAVLVHKGLPLEAACAALACAPAGTRLAAGVAWRARRARLALGLALAAALGGVSGALLVLAMHPAPATRDWHALLSGAPDALGLATTVAFAACLAASLVWRGPRPWVGQEPHVHRAGGDGPHPASGRTHDHEHASDPAGDNHP